MTGPNEPDGLAATASKSIEQSVEEERDAVGDGADEGGLVPPDRAQSAPPPD
jgi:hypothetical protein